jgi:hypothetical protein
MKSSSPAVLACGFSGLPVGDEDFVGAFSAFGSGGLGFEPLLVVIGGAGLAVGRRVEFASVAYARFFAAAYSAGLSIGAAARACMPEPPLAAGKTKSAWVTGTL